MGFQHQASVFQDPLLYGGAVVVPETVLIQVYRLVSGVVHFKIFKRVGAALIGCIGHNLREQQGSGKFRPGRLLADSYGSFSADRRIHAVVHLHMIGKASGSGKGIRGNRGSKGSLLIFHGILAAACLCGHGNHSVQDQPRQIRGCRDLIRSAWAGLLLPGSGNGGP